MDLKAFIPVGTLLKPHKLNGGLKISFHHFLLVDPEEINTLFIGSETKPLPYFVEWLKPTTGNVFLTKLEDINSPEDAGALKGKEIYVTAEQYRDWFDQTDSDNIDPHNLIGFNLFDHTGKAIGTIDDIYEMNMQDLAVLHIKGNEVLIPLAEGNIIEIDQNKKTIKVDIPEGLLDLYI